MSSTPRFFVQPTDITHDQVTLPPDAAHHARSVLRLRVGEEIIVHDGLGKAYRCRLTDIASKHVAAAVEQSSPITTEPRTRITVVQSLPKTAEKIEQVLQHGTEIGAERFLIFGSARSEARLEEEKLARRLERWRGIVRGAAEQSGRGILPDVGWCGRPKPFFRNGWTPGHICLLLHESATTSLAQVLTGTPPERTLFQIWVGPEGGFTEEEVAFFREGGGQVVSLGPRVLRTETAALVALSQILYARDG